MTANLPKPLLPVANRPILTHVLNLLRRHGFSETVVTVSYLASLVRTYMGDGEELGLHLTYSTEESPLGTAGSVKNAEPVLGRDRFLVISGDALTDVDLTAMLRHHEEHGALVTVALKRVPDPLEFGIVITGADGRVSRFLEKPTWGQVFSDTVNTGIYVMEAEVLDRITPGAPADWSADVLPGLLAAGAPVSGYVTERYWEDIGTHESYFKAHADVLNRKVEVEIDGFELSPGVWIGEGAAVDPEAVVVGPVLVGPYVKVEAGAELHEYTVLGSNVVVQRGAVLHRAICHDNTFVGAAAALRGCVLGKGSTVLGRAHVDEGAVVGEDCVVEEEALVQAGVKIYPFKTIEAGAVVNTSVIWESRGQRSLFGPRGVSGLLNVDITPELAVRLAGAYATTLDKGSVVVVGRDASRGARALERAVISALTAAAVEVRDLEVAPVPVVRFETARCAAMGGVVLRTTAADADGLDIVFLDAAGNDLSPDAQRRLERVYSRQEFRRAFPGEIADLTVATRVVESYTHELLSTVDVTGVRETSPRVVVDAAGGAAALVLPFLMGRLGVDVLTLGGRLDPVPAAVSVAERMRSLDRIGELVASSRAAFGVLFDPTGERLALVDERGEHVSDDRALLVLMDLVAAERRRGLVALPVTTTRVAQRVAEFHGVGIRWTATAPDELTRAAAAPDVIFAGDGRGGVVIPEFGAHLDALAAFVRLLGLVARTQLSLSEIDGRIPRAYVVRRAVPTPWAVKGRVMRTVAAAAAGRELDLTDGCRIVEPDGRWALVLPDPAEAVTHVWAEGSDALAASAYVDEWAGVLGSAVSLE